MTDSAKQHYKLGDYKNIESRLAATGGAVLNGTAANVDFKVRFGELNRSK